MSNSRPPPVGQPQMSKMRVPPKSDSMSVNSKTGSNKSVFNKISGTATSTMTSTAMKVSQGT